jgi:hypothetical protein
MLHHAVLIEMLDDEVAVAEERLGGRAGPIERDGTDIHVFLGDGLTLRLDGARYDGEPFRVAVTTTEGHPAPHEKWPPGLSLGIHPVLNRPFACVQGTYEYHSHPSHLADQWATYRNELRLADLLDHLLRKAGR